MTETLLNDSDLQLHLHKPNIYVLTLRKLPENRLDSAYCQKLITQIHRIESLINASNTSPSTSDSATSPSEPSAPPGGALILRGSDHKFFCTGLDLSEPSRNPHANSDGFFPLLATLLDFPYPTIALLTGHTFGGACPLALAHDYRIMNSKRGFISMPPVNLGLHFPGIGALPRLKLAPRVARKMLLEAHRWTGKEALEEGIVDEVVEPEGMLERAVEKGRELAPRGGMGVYSLLRNELYGEAAERIRAISYVHGRRTDLPPRAKI